MPNTENSEIIIRAPTFADLQAVVDLVNACSIAEGGTPDESPEGWRVEWESAKFSLDTDAWVALAPDGRVIGYEQVEVRDDGSPFGLDGYVHPLYRGQGIGTRLLRLMEARARQALSRSGQAATRLRGNIEATNQAAQQLFGAEGYLVVRRFWRMEIDMAAPPAPAEWPRGITVRAFVPGQDEHAAYDAIEEAFSDHWEHSTIGYDEWARRNFTREDFDPSLWFLALDSDQVAGAVLGSIRGEQAGWIRSLGVRRAWRGCGLGLALLRESFRAFYAHGRTNVGLGVDAQSLTGATRLYERAGMSVTERYETVEKMLQRE